MRGRFQLGEARSTCWSSELAEGGRGAVGFTQQPARSKQQLVSFALHRCCFICFVSFPPRQNSSGDMEGKLASSGVWIRARHCLGEAPGGAGPSGRSLMLNSGEEKAQLVPLLVPKFHICVHPEW